MLYARKAPDEDKAEDEEEAYEFMLHDLNTGNEVPLPGLRIASNNPRAGFWMRRFLPDHQWLLFNCCYGGTFVCRLDGSHYVEMGTYRADSRASWYGTQGHKILRVYRNQDRDKIVRCNLCDISHPKQVTPFPIPAAEAEEYDLAFRMHQAGPVAAVTIYGKVLRLPFLATVNGGSLSPSHDKIALELVGARTTLWQQWLRRFFPKVGKQSMPERSLWVLSLQGEGMQEIGKLPHCSIPPTTKPNLIWKNSMAPRWRSVELYLCRKGVFCRCAWPGKRTRSLKPPVPC